MILKNNRNMKKCQENRGEYKRKPRIIIEITAITNYKQDRRNCKQDTRIIKNLKA